jgi:hypothetical protein
MIHRDEIATILVLALAILSILPNLPLIKRLAISLLMSLPLGAQNFCGKMSQKVSYTSACSDPLSSLRAQNNSRRWAGLLEGILSEVFSRA